MATQNVSDDIVRLRIEQKIHKKLDNLIGNRMDRDKVEPSVMVNELTLLTEKKPPLALKL